MRVTVTGHRYTTLLRITVTGRLILDPCISSRHWRRIVDAAAGRVLALDMSGVTQVDAAGLGLLVTLAVEAAAPPRTAAADVRHAPGAHPGADHGIGRRARPGQRTRGCARHPPS